MTDLNGSAAHRSLGYKKRLGLAKGYVGQRGRGLSLIVGIVFLLFFVSTVPDVVMRFSGEIFGILFLRDTVPLKIFNGLVALIIFFISIFSLNRGPKIRILFLLCVSYLVGLSVVHLIFSPPALPDAWDTIPEEFFRSFALAWYLYPIFYINRYTEINKNFISKISIYSSVILVFFSFLQSLEILPNFYFQWYQRSHLPRPTGGLEHPHFFALILVIGISVVLARTESGVMKKSYAGGIILAMLIGIAISTSRVGMISALVLFLVYFSMKVKTKYKITISIIAVYIISVFIVMAILNWDRISGTSLENYFNVFLYAFRDSFDQGLGSDRFLRGRGMLWDHEIELITASPLTIMFGYGHQPFVSHNLILRQLQTSGITGTIAYFSMLFSLSLYWIKEIDTRRRPVVYSLLAAMSVASLTFPVLVSVPIICGVVVAAAITIPREEERNTDGRGRRTRRSSVGWKRPPVLS